MNKKHLFFTLILSIFCIQNILSMSSPMKIDEMPRALTYPLHEAAREGNIDAVTTIVIGDLYNKLINQKDNFGKTPLHYAFGKNSELLKFLIDRKADINAQDQNGKTVLHYAAMDKFPSVVKYLIEHGAKANIKDFENRTPLHYAACRGRAENCCILLHNIHSTADVHAKTREGKTADVYAYENNHLKLYHTLKGYSLLT